MISVIFLVLSGMSLYMLLKPESAELQKEDKVLMSTFEESTNKRFGEA